MNRTLLFVSMLPFALGACGASVSLVPGNPDAGGDAAVANDVPASPDVPVTTDVPPWPPADRPALPDVPVIRADVPVTTRDVPVTSTDVPATCDWGGASGALITFTGPGATPYDCSAPRGAPPGGPGLLNDRIVAVTSVSDDATGSTLGVDFCSPAADCVALPGRIRIAAAGFTLGAAPIALQPGQLIRVRSRASWSWGCTMQIEISNAPMWDGEMNPVRHDSALLAAAASGEATTLPGAPFGLSRESIGCVDPTTPTCGGGARELFALAFQGHCNTCLRDPDPVVVRQARVGMFTINGTEYVGRNLMSYNSGACDDYWSYAWTAREIWLE